LVWAGTMADKLVTVAEYMDSMQAQLALQTLTDYGIKAILSGQHATDVYGGVPGFATVKLQVMESDADDAKHILESAAVINGPGEFDEFDDLDKDEPDEKGEQ
jgi:hypothetical protein